MPYAKHDENGRPTLICASSADGETIVPIKINPNTHALNVIDGTTGIDLGNNHGAAVLDENGVAVFSALSSSGDGSIVEVYGDVATGAILIKNS